MSPRAGVRIAIVGIFAVLATVFVVSDARSQPRPGGIGGMPRPNFPQPPKFPTPPTFTPPNFPQSPTIPNFPAPPTIPSMPNIPRGPQFETVWSCGKCNAELGRGNSKPSFDSCPKCGVRFINGGGGGAGGFGLVRPPPPAVTSPPANTSADPDLLPRGNGGNESTTFTAPPSSSGSDTAKAPSSEEKPNSKTGSLILKIMIGVFGFLFLLGMVGGAFLIIQANKGSKPAKKSRRKALDLDDEDDD
jgi:hypothetical protein